MARLELFLLGPPCLQRDGVLLQFDRRQVMAIAAYLAMSSLETKGRHVSRDSLVTLLWPDLEPSRARAVFRRNLSLLRRALQDEWLVADRERVGTDPDADFWLDVDQFARLVHACETHGHPREQVCPRCLEALTKAAALYRGDFLQGFGLRDSVEFDDWQFFQAEELRQQMASVLERLACGHGAQGSFEAALPYARRWLALDPLHEPAHRKLMELYAAAGRRSAATRQYDECVRILQEELGLAPAEETTALYEQIRVAPAAAGDLPAKPGPIDSLWLLSREAAPRYNLPAQTTSFIGREQELVDLHRRLQDPGCRLLTLLGPGGIGKTRLALRLAEVIVEAAAPTFADGVFYVSLAPLRTAEGVVPAVAEALGYTFHIDVAGGTRVTQRQQLLDYLRRKQLLLVMDNYEHLLVEGTPGSEGDGAGFPVELLATAPGIKVLVTSRASLKVQGEHLYHLAGLRVPEVTPPDPTRAAQAFRDYSAVELFLYRAEQVRPELELGPHDLMNVARICSLVQGMPLAILLAAAWVEMLTPEEILAEIRQSLSLLATDLLDVPLRQRSIRATFDYSWRLLNEREQEVFLGLSVFRSSFTREAAQEVVGASLRDLMSLLNKSLLVLSSPSRYELHELLRQYATERLGLAPEHGDTLRDRHCAYHSSALERWASELKGARQRETAAEMHLGIEDAQAAWYWAVRHRQVARLAQAVDGLWLYHEWRTRYEEAEAAFRAGAKGLETVDTWDAQRLRAKCLILCSHFRFLLARKQPSIEAAQQGFALLQDLEKAGQDVRHEMALAMFHKGRIKHYYSNDSLEAKKLLTKSVVLYEEVGDRWGLARALANMGWMAELVGQLGEARALCQKSLAIRRELGNQYEMADAMRYLGIISWVQGHLDEALPLLQESLDIHRAGDDWIRIGQSMKSLGELLVRRGRYGDGLALLERCVDEFGELAYAFGTSAVLPFVAEVKLHLGCYGEARVDALQGLTLARQANFRWGVGFSLFANGLAALAEGACHEALSLLQESAAALEEVGHRENRGWVAGPLGMAALATGETALAGRCILEALEIGVELGAFMPVIYGLPAAALLLAGQGAAERAVEVYACVSRYEFVARSRWFEDLVGRPVAAAAAPLQAELVQAARERGRELEWHVTAAQLLAELQPW